MRNVKANTVARPDKGKASSEKGAKPRVATKQVATKNGMSNGSTGDETVTMFFSAGGRSTQPLFSDLCRNFVAVIELNGNPFFTGTQPTRAVSKYDYNRIALNVSDYFVDNLFGAYDYYRVKNVETTFTWCHLNSDGAVNGELLTSIDKDSRDAENSNTYINRRNLSRRVFDVNNLSHTISYRPYMVDIIGQDEDSEVNYIQPLDRWWNTADFRSHRWGCMRYMLIDWAPDNTSACVFVKHRVWLEVKGQKDLVTPSVPPASAEYYGKQLVPGAFMGLAPIRSTTG